MSIRFRRRLKIAKGLHLNIGKRGLGLSAGVRGATVSVGRQGVYTNTGIPGTGLSYRTRVNGSSSTSSSRASSESLAGGRAREPGSVSINLRVDKDGVLHIEDSNGQALPNSLVHEIKKRHPDAIQQVLAQAVSTFNLDLQNCTNLHCATPAGGSVPPLPDFNEPVPVLAEFEEPRFLAKLLNPVFGQADAIEERNKAKLAAHDKAMYAWRHSRHIHQTDVEKIKTNFGKAANGDQEAMESVLGYVLGLIQWPRETAVSFDFGNDSSTLDIDVDLPNIADMPAREAKEPARGTKITFRNRSEAQIRKDYCLMAHGSLFRVIGEVFAALPSVRVVTASGYTQRIDSATGKELNEYVLSVRITRESWQKIDLNNLESVDPIAALGQFGPRLSLDRSSNMRAIDPFREGM